MFRVVERFPGNSRYHFVTQIGKHVDNQVWAHFVSGNEFWKMFNYQRSISDLTNAYAPLIYPVWKGALAYAKLPINNPAELLLPKV